MKLKRCYKHIKDENIIFEKMITFATLTYQTLSLKCGVNVLGDGDGARGGNFRRAPGHHLCPTDTIF